MHTEERWQLPGWMVAPAFDKACCTCTLRTCTTAFRSSYETENVGRPRLGFCQGGHFLAGYELNAEEEPAYKLEVYKWANSY